MAYSYQTRIYKMWIDADDDDQIIECSQSDLLVLVIQIRRLSTNFRILYANINVNRLYILTKKGVRVYLWTSTWNGMKKESILNE
jgi:hypothetical protein